MVKKEIRAEIVVQIVKKLQKVGIISKKAYEKVLKMIKKGKFRVIIPIKKATKNESICSKSKDSMSSSSESGYAEDEESTYFSQRRW